MERSSNLDQRIGGIAALDQPLRRELYRLLSERDGWLSRDEAADAVGVARSVAAFHLDKLVEAGIVDVRFERPPGRTGPGAGRPAKLYRPTHDELSVSVPVRHYELAGSLLAAGITDSIRTGQPVAECLSAAAHAAGRRIGEQARARSATMSAAQERTSVVSEVLAGYGYEPVSDQPGAVGLANCPFHYLADQHRPLVCGMNLDFIHGIIEALGPTGSVEARLAPEPGRCCVRLTTS